MFTITNDSEVRVTLEWHKTSKNHLQETVAALLIDGVTSDLIRSQTAVIDILP